MNNRERAMAILHYEKPDRMPAVHFGYWEELLLEWVEQRKIPAELAHGCYDGSEHYRKQVDKAEGTASRRTGLSGPYDKRPQCCVGSDR